MGFKGVGASQHLLDATLAPSFLSSERLHMFAAGSLIATYFLLGEFWWSDSIIS